MASSHTARKVTGLIVALLVACTGMIGKPGTASAQVAYAVLHAFTRPVFSWGPLVRGGDGAFYGTTYYGGIFNRGTVFKLAPDGTGFTSLHSFTGSDGVYPEAGLVQGPDGALYGTTPGGGISDNGIVFKLATDGTGFTTLHSFTWTDGSYPSGGVIQGSDGDFYGTTYQAGPSSAGTVFKLAADGTGFTTLHSFSGRGSDGDAPQAGLIQGADGAFYGTTILGGTFYKGTVFKLAADGTGYTILHSFTKIEGALPPAALVQGTDGALYGTTSEGGAFGHGTIFKLAPDGTGLTTLHSFSGFDGDYPLAGLVQGTDGAFYGTTAGGGPGDGGVVFVLQPSALPTVTLQVNQPTFHTGQQLTLAATVTPSATPMTTDVYVALQLPNGRLLFLQGGGGLTAAM